MSNSPNSQEPHSFGGDWTARKLAILRSCLQRYTTALKNQPFTKWYVDAFAGSGTIEVKQSPTSDVPLFPDLQSEEARGLINGSAREALAVEPAFDRYLLIEKNPSRAKELESLKIEYAPKRIFVHCGDANEAIQKLCDKDWGLNRAVLFLDPYGTQVHWDTLVAVAATKSIDMWLLFPLAIGVNRMTPKVKGDIPEEWLLVLNRLLGCKDWIDVFYETRVERTLFGDEEVSVKIKCEEMGRYFVERLKTIFPHVAAKPAVLSNSRHSPMYLLCFAAANENGGKIALRIADHLLSKW